MSVREVTYYVVQCDGCGKDADYGDWTAWSDRVGAYESLSDDWETVGSNDLCPNCWTWDEGGEHKIKRIRAAEVGEPNG